MAGVDVGGDESVMWHVQVDKVRRNPAPKHEQRGQQGWRHQGVDETIPGSQFTVTVKMPANSANFVATLRQAADNAQRLAGSPGALISFTLPIEQGNHDQIRIAWDSAP